MQRLLCFLLLIATVSHATPPHPALARVMPVIEFRDSYYEDTIEFLRTKGTEILRENTNNDAAILIFEYRFAPRMWGERVRGPAKYRETNVPFHDVLRDVLAQFDLGYEIIGPDRIAIVDRRKVPESK